MCDSYALLTSGKVSHDTTVVVWDYTPDGTAAALLPAVLTGCVLYVRGLSHSACNTGALGVHIGLVGDVLAPVGEVVVFHKDPETLDHAVLLAELLLALKISPIRSFGASVSLTLCHTWCDGD
jgi:hypothetical protein